MICPIRYWKIPVQGMLQNPHIENNIHHRESATETINESNDNNDLFGCLHERAETRVEADTVRTRSTKRGNP